MVMPGLINLDFADIRAVMSEMGKAMMGTGEAEGERRAIDAAEAAISNPLLEDVSMKGARGVLINITGGIDMTLFEVDEAANRIREEVDPDANIIFGSTFDEKLAGRMRISVVATGIDVETMAHPKPLEQMQQGGSRRSRSGPPSVARPVAPPVPVTPAMPAETEIEPALAAGAGPGARRRRRASRRSRPKRWAAAASRPSARSSRSSVRPAARHSRRSRPTPSPMRRWSNGGRHAAKAKARAPSLFERVTSAGRLIHPQDEPAAEPHVCDRRRRRPPGRPAAGGPAATQPAPQPAARPGTSGPRQGRGSAGDPGLPAPAGQLRRRSGPGDGPKSP